METLSWITIAICAVAIVVCLYTLWKMKYIAKNVVENRRDIMALNENDNKLLAYIKQLNHEFRNEKKERVKISKIKQT